MCFVHLFIRLLQFIHIQIWNGVCIHCKRKTHFWNGHFSVLYYLLEEVHIRRIQNFIKICFFKDREHYFCGNDTQKDYWMLYCCIFKLLSKYALVHSKFGSSAFFFPIAANFFELKINFCLSLQAISYKKITIGYWQVLQKWVPPRKYRRKWKSIFIFP